MLQFHYGQCHKNIFTALKVTSQEGSDTDLTLNESKSVSITTSVIDGHKDIIMSLFTHLLFYSFCLTLSLSLWLYSPLDLAAFLSFLILYIIGRAP
jgi:hypothetical protein